MSFDIKFLPNLQYVAKNTAAKAEEVEILLVQNGDVLCKLEGQETVAELQAMSSVTQHDMVSYLLNKFGMFSMYTVLMVIFQCDIVGLFFSVWLTG